MPETSEGYEATGQKPNAAVSRFELDPSRFDHQTMEIILTRLNRTIGMPEKADLNAALAQIQSIIGQRDNALAGVRSAWEYLHQRFNGLKCGPQGTWVEALNEIVAHIAVKDRQIQDLNAMVATMKAQFAERGMVPPVRPDSAPPLLQSTDLLEWIKRVPSMFERLDQLDMRLAKVESSAAAFAKLG